MAPKKLGDVERKRTIRHLRQLIDALDSRVPRIERLGEGKIASDAATLRAKALKRIAELES
jgi:hypothetical protein